MIADLPARLPLICPRCGRVSERGRELWTVSLVEVFASEPAAPGMSSPVLNRVADAAPEPVEVLEGVLRCDNAACQASYPIVDGIPILVSDPAQLLCNQPAGLLLSLRPETLALLVQGASDDAPLQRVLEHLSIYLDAHWGDCAEPRLSPPAGPWGGEALFSALDARFAASPPKGFVVELGCGVGRGLAMLRRKSALAVGIDLHLPALRAARRLLRGETLSFARRSLGRHYQAATLRPPAAGGLGQVALICADALDPPLPPESAEGVVALNLLDSVSHPGQLLSVLDGLCCDGGELFLASPYSWQSSVVHEGARLGEPTGDAAAVLRSQLISGAGLRARYELSWQSDLPWELRRDARCLHRYLVDALAARKMGPTSYA